MSAPVLTNGPTLPREFSIKLEISEHEAAITWLIRAIASEKGQPSSAPTLEDLGFHITELFKLKHELDTYTYMCVEE